MSKKDMLTEYKFATYIGGDEAEVEEFMSCAVGIISGAGLQDRMCYDYDKCVQLLVDRDGMDLEEAEEYFQFNILGAYVGDRTPVFLWSREMERVGPMSEDLMEKVMAEIKEREDAERPGTATDRS